MKLDWKKRTGLFLLSAVYLFSTMGTVITLHYCRGRVMHVEWEAFAALRKTPVPLCGKTAAMCPSCCKNELKVLRLGDVHQPAVAQPFSFPVATLPVAAATLPLLSLPGPGNDHSGLAHAPPLQGPPLLYLRYCHFAI